MGEVCYSISQVACLDFWRNAKQKYQWRGGTRTRPGRKNEMLERRANRALGADSFPASS